LIFKKKTWVRRIWATLYICPGR